MNNLSWIIYFANTVPAWGFWMGAVAGTVLLGAGIKGFIFEERVPYMKSLLVIAMVFMFISVSLPSKKTIMLIAASEYGETLAQSPEMNETAQKAYDALQKWLDSYLTSER